MSKSTFDAALQRGPFYVYVYIEHNASRYIVKVEVEEVAELGFKADGKFYYFADKLKTWRFETIRDDTAYYLLIQKTKGLIYRFKFNYSNIEADNMSLVQLEEACDLLKQLIDLK